MALREMQRSLDSAARFASESCCSAQDDNVGEAPASLYFGFFFPNNPVMLFTRLF